MALCALVPVRQRPDSALSERIIRLVGILAQKAVCEHPRLDRIGIKIGRVVHSQRRENVIVHVFFVRGVQESLREMGEHGVHVIIVLRVLSEACGRSEVSKE